MKKKLIVIAGPTASGKTSLSVDLAKKLATVVFSADSRQFYKEMSIGTAKPSLEEMQGIQHFFINSHSIHQEVSVANYVSELLPLLEIEFKQHETIILTGGSGMFIDAVCFGLDDIPHSLELRTELTNEVESNGLAALLQELKLKDEAYFNEVDQNNPVRIIRAIEAIRLTGKKYSELRLKTPKNRSFEVEFFVINHPREELYKRINQRVENMLTDGLEDEVQQLYPYKNLQALNTVGYKEFFDIFDGLQSKEQAVEMIKQNSRRYAKRQITWFKRWEKAHWLEYASNERMIESILLNAQFQ